MQPPVGLAGAFADQRNRILEKIGLLVGEQLGAITDRRHRADQIVAETGGKQFNDAQINSLAHRGMLAWWRKGGNVRMLIKSGFY